MDKKFLVFLSILLITGNAWAHEHKPPHQGTLVELGEEFSHLEFVLDKEQGVLTAYALDGEAEHSIRLKQEKIQLSITIPPDPQKGLAEKKVSLLMAAVENCLTGESVGDTSEFQGQSNDLKQMSNFDAVILEVVIKGGDFKDVKFNYPVGNEDHGKTENGKAG